MTSAATKSAPNESEKQTSWVRRSRRLSGLTAREARSIFESERVDGLSGVTMRGHEPAKVAACPTKRLHPRRHPRVHPGPSRRASRPQRASDYNSMDVGG
eukprot:4755401-Prymnesium_polylepis.1